MSRFKLWTQSTRSIVSHKLDHYHGRRYLDIEHLVKQLTLCLDFCSTIQRPGQLLYRLCSTLTSTNWGTRALDCQMEVLCLSYSTSLKTSIIWNPRLFNNVFHPGTLDLRNPIRCLCEKIKLPIFDSLCIGWLTLTYMHFIWYYRDCQNQYLSRAEGMSKSLIAATCLRWANIRNM